MRILNTKTLFLTALILITLSSKMNAQDQNITVSQDPKFEELLNKKRKTNTLLALNNSYTIQIYNGSSENAKKTLNEFKQEFKSIEATIVFNTPNYKVWVGNFKSRIEAERNLVVIKSKFKNTLLIKSK